jgi:hypothetical protein
MVFMKKWYTCVYTCYMGERERERERDRESEEDGASGGRCNGKELGTVQGGRTDEWRMGSNASLFVHMGG